MAITEFTSVKPNDTNRTFIATKPQTTPSHDLPEDKWSDVAKISFRFFFIYFLILIIPWDWKYYRDLLNLDWSVLHFSQLFYAFKYIPTFVYEWPSFIDWLAFALLAVIGTVAWGINGGNDKNYNTLYYWLRVAVRYRLAAALIGYAFIKIFPMQMPLPSLSNLNTNYGDISDWKLFSMSTGIVPGYETFLGFVELFAALLLFNRRTASIGAFIIIPFSGNVVMSNIAYEGGEYVYGLMLVSFAVFILWYDVPRLLSLTSFEKVTSPPVFRPTILHLPIRNARYIAKSIFILITITLYGSLTYASYRSGGYQYPNTRGLSNAAGIYDVSEFRVNGKLIPYAVDDRVRWKDVVFEKWGSLSIRTINSSIIDHATTEEIFIDNSKRLYESSGIAGRQYYAYTIDSVNQAIQLTNKNKNVGLSNVRLYYERPTKETIVLHGVDAHKDSIYVILNRMDKKYLLNEAAKGGRRKGLKL